MLIKKKIKYNNNDMFIDLPMSKSNGFTGYQQEINKYKEEKTQESINETRDGEIIRFESSFSHDINVYFYKETTQEYLNEYIAKGISYEDSLNLSQNYLNSFFILDFFDTFRSNNQTRIFTTYISKLYYSNNKKYYNNDDEFKNYNVSSYKVNDYFQTNYLNIPSWYVKEKNTSFDLYMRLSFYNAKTGNVSVFFNGVYGVNSSSPLKMYFRMRFNSNNNSYILLDNIQAYELFLSQDYIERFNDTFDNFDNLQQNYPTGRVFNFEDGQYIDNNN